MPGAGTKIWGETTTPTYPITLKSIYKKYLNLKSSLGLDLIDSQSSLNVQFSGEPAVGSGSLSDFRSNKLLLSARNKTKYFKLQLNKLELDERTNKRTEEEH